MPPTRESCEALESRLSQKASFIEAYESVRDSVFDIGSSLFTLKYGGGLADALSSELVAMVSSVASDAAEAFSDSATSASNAVIEEILNKFMIIFLSAPTALYSIVSIPHDQAKKAVEAESIFIAKAKNNIDTALRIILKWTASKSGNDFFAQMKDSLPLITRAIQLSEDIITGLRNQDNSVFDEAKYNLMKGLIQEAVEITKPKSAIADKFGIRQRIESDKERRYAEKKAKIIDDYKKSKADINRSHKEDIASVSGTLNSSGSSLSSISSLSDNVGAASKEYAINLLYQNRLRDLEAEKKVRLAGAKAQAEAEALADSQNWIPDIGDINAQFSYDMELLLKSLTDLLLNIVKAAAKNRESQSYCNNITDMNNLIRNLINEIIEALRKTGNLAGSAAAVVIEEAQTNLEQAQELFERDIERYGGSSITATALSRDVALGHAYIRSADVSLGSAITDSLIESVNADDTLESADESFADFIRDLANIPDWDGRRNVWAVDIANSSLSPYVQLTADLTTLISKVSILSFSSNDEDRLEMRNLIIESNRTFRVIKAHNLRVNSVLGSYIPYSSSEMGDIKRILSRAGVLKEFALTMSLVATTANIVAYSVSFAFGADDGVNYDSCSKAFPDIFDSQEVASAAASAEADIPAEQESEAFNETSEDNEDDIKATKMRIRSNMSLSSQNNKDLDP